MRSLDWNLVNQEAPKKLKNGYTKKTQTVRAVFLQPLSLHNYPFDAHKLSIVLISNAATDVFIDKLRSVKDAATIHKDATSLFKNSSWRLLEPKAIDGQERMDGVVCSFDCTPKEESEAERSYVRMTARLCVERQARATSVLAAHWDAAVYPHASSPAPRTHT